MNTELTFVAIFGLFCAGLGQDFEFPSEDYSEVSHSVSQRPKSSTTPRSNEPFHRRRTSTRRSTVENYGEEEIKQTPPPYQEKPIPVIEQSICPGNQLYYPGERNTDPWFCDCGGGYIYYKPKNECYLAYRKGPCEDGEFLILRDRNVECARNPCEDNFIRFKNRCYELEKSGGACPRRPSAVGILKVDINTLNIVCNYETSPLTLFSFPDRCPPGSKRDANNKCRENWNV